MTDRESRCAFWVDAYSGEPVRFEDMMTDLTQTDVIYLGERHTIKRHHEIQNTIVRSLIANGKQVVLGLEQLEADQQPFIEQYNRGELTFEELAERTQWPSRWGNYRDYRQTLETVNQSGGIVVGLNANRDIVRQVARKGLSGMSPAERSQLPEKIDINSPSYRRHLGNVMKAMMHVQDSPDMLDRMFTAQVCRDEMMAGCLSAALKTCKQDNRIAVVLCGSQHVSHGAGIPSRLKRRLPEVEDRIIVLSGSGDVVLSESSRQMARDITVTHQQLKCFSVPVADYLHVAALADEPESCKNTTNSNCN